MSRPFALFAVFASALAMAGCAQGDDIDTGGAVYDGISPEAAIMLTGTEPFWGIEIEPASGASHAARFTSPDNIEGSAFTATRFAGNNGLGFAGKLDGKAVTIAITPGECSDGMSDRAYPFTVTVAVGDTVLYGCAHTSDQPFTGPAAP